MDSYLERLQQAIASATHGMTSEELTRHPEGTEVVHGRNTRASLSDLHRDMKGF